MWQTWFLGLLASHEANLRVSNVLFEVGYSQRIFILVSVRMRSLQSRRGDTCKSTCYWRCLQSQHFSRHFLSLSLHSYSQNGEKVARSRGPSLFQVFQLQYESTGKYRICKWHIEWIHYICIVVASYQQFLREKERTVWESRRLFISQEMVGHEKNKVREELESTV